MDFSQPTFAHPDLDAAIDKHPLIAAPDTSLIKAIALMGNKRMSCGLETQNLELDSSDSISSSSCILVLDQDNLIGIFTERDIVKLTAQERPFADLTLADVMTQPVITLEEKNFPDIFAVLFLFRRYQIRHLPIVDAQANPIGVVSPETIRQAMKPANLLKLRRVGEVMSKSIVHTSLDTSVLDVARLMTQERVSCIILTQLDIEENILIPAGIITERDILQFKLLELKLDDLEASQVMSTPLF
ncbi:MAG: CBS domain-containing protein [Cyanobacteria bacterium P01_C01_bin.72]